MSTETFDLVIRGATVVTPQGPLNADVAVGQGRIHSVVEGRLPADVAIRTVDGTGKILIPGGVDPHCHVGMTLGEYNTLDDYASASIAALHGGTTTIIDFAIPGPNERPIDAVRERRAAAHRSRCDTALHGCVTSWDESTADQIAQMADSGVRTIKIFTTYRDLLMVPEDTVIKVMRALRGCGGLAYVHAESNAIVEDALAGAGRCSAAHHAAGRPETAELSAVAQVLAAAAYCAAAVYFVHLSTPRSVELVRAARCRGVAAFGETCPHYLELDERAYGSPTAANYVCCPPLRAASSVDGLRACAVRGEIDTLGSDHCCYSTLQKSEHSDDVTRMPNGLPGVETRLPVGFTSLVARGGMPLEGFTAMFSTTPARVNGLTSKGVIAAGADADLVLVDATAWRPAMASELHMATDYTPYEGRCLTGWPVFVVQAGRVVLGDDGFRDPGATGRQLMADPIPVEDS